MNYSERQFARDQSENAVASEYVKAVGRPLGALEHLFWLYDPSSSVHFAVTALICGRTSPRDWRRALDRLQERHPLMSVSIQGEPGSLPVFQRVDAAPIPLRIVEDEPERRWEAEIGEELATPFKSSEAPLIRAVLIQGARDDAAFMLVAHHSIADGLSLAYALRDTLGAIAGRPLTPLPWLPAQDDLIKVSEALTNGREQRHGEATKPSVYRRQDNSRPTVQALRLSPDLTSSVRDRARQEGTTVHGALCSALVLASRQIFDEWRGVPLRVMSPINARPLLEVGDNFGVFVSATTSVFDGEVRDFWDLARAARAGIAANQNSEYIAAGLAAFRDVVGNGADLATAAEFVAQAFANEIMVTNLGSLSFIPAKCAISRKENGAGHSRRVGGFRSLNPQPEACERLGYGRSQQLLQDQFAQFSAITVGHKRAPP